VHVHRLRHGDRRRRRAALNDPREIVRSGYDRIAARYAAMITTNNPAPELVRDLDARLPDGADVLELGCGAGVPGAVVLAPRHRYVGVDISAAQLDRARRRLPDATFVEADYTMLELDPASLDAVVAILTLTHVPRVEHAGLFRRISEWLRPEGFFLASFGTGDTEDEVEDDWLGAPMFFSHFDTETNRRLVREAGLHVLRDEVIAMEEEGHGEARFLWVLGQKPPLE
jgi:SAM-dependent methyltransferase